MFANNEIGTIQPIGEIGKIAKEKGIIFLHRCCTSSGNAPIDVNELNIDLIFISSQVYGPRVGFIYKKGVKITSFIHGGAQERGRRASTENVAGIVGLGEAIKIATENMEETIKNC